MKKFILIALVSTFAISGFSQTKKIAHRSHSGKDNTFSIFGPDNFGETPEMAKKREEEKRKQDSIAKRAAADSIAQLDKHPKKKKKNKNKS